MTNKFDFTRNYKKVLNDVIEELERCAKDTPKDVLIEAIRGLTDDFIEQTGVRPTPSQLERLTDVILAEEISDPNPYKMTHNEYPIMSERQLWTRIKRELNQSDWNMDTGSKVVGFRVSHYTDDNGTPRRTRQPIYDRGGM
jgi:hypothetical protein